MIYLKTKEEIETIRLGADILGRVHGLLSKEIKPGVSTIRLDKLAYEYICDHGASPSFKDVPGYFYTLCTSVDSAVVHGIPSEEKLLEGSVVSVDCGVYYKGFHSDSAYTYSVGDICKEKEDLLIRTKKSLYVGIEALNSGARVGDVGFAIQEYIGKFGYGIVRDLTGHGVGRSLYGDPSVPNYGKRGRGAKIRDGLVVAIEPMIVLGSEKVLSDKSDGWTINTVDGKCSAHYEHTVAFYDGKPDILTTFEYIDQSQIY